MNDNPPAILLGGAENAVSAARALRSQDVKVIAVNGVGAPVLRSRGVTGVALGFRADAASIEEWIRHDGLTWSGGVLIPLSDHAVDGLARCYPFALDHYHPAVLVPELAHVLLDKGRTLELAERVDISAPRQWVLDGRCIPADMTYPVVLKPRRNFELLALTGRKHLRVDSADELREQLTVMENLPSGFVINEFIPGGDECLTSYYSLTSGEGERHMEFTKRVDRRYPSNEGGATYHELVQLPDTAELGRRLVGAIGACGLFNAEFKTDPRSGRMVLIECNYRLTAATRLMQDNGLDVVGAVYRQALGRVPTAPGGAVRWGATMWYPVRDFRSFRASGLGLADWARRPWTSTMPYWSAVDPMPSLTVWSRTARAHGRRLLTPRRR